MSWTLSSLLDPALSILAAFVLDLVWGDPEWFPHPVRGIGWLAVRLEEGMVILFGRTRIGGVFFTLTIVGISYLATAKLIGWVSQYHSSAGWILNTLILYTAFAAKDLKDHSHRVFRAIQHKKLSLARKELSKMVKRDTSSLPEREIVRGTVESVAENSVDGVFSPLFYAFIGGAPLAMAFKAASTLDAMVGYKNERYLQFGWASARLDDLLNFIPARLVLIFFPLACFFRGLSAVDTFQIARRDGRKNPSPNAGIPQAAMAGALGIQLGGANVYEGVLHPKPLIGENKRELEVQDILRANQMMLASSILFVVIAALIRWLF
jgi:adenosylcobinamide-phosphate synthase